MKNSKIRRRIIEISYAKKLSHLGSCLSALDIIKDIYDKKNPQDIFVLSSGHAGLALYVVQEACGGRNAEEVFDHHGVHPDRCDLCDLSVSAGSLGHGLGIAVGMALALPSQTIYCLISDGECSEGSIWEALRIADELKLTNLDIHVNHNNYGAYKFINNEYLIVKLNRFAPNMITHHITSVNQLPFLKDQAAHYYTMTEDDYKQAMEIYAD